MEKSEASQRLVSIFAIHHLEINHDNALESLAFFVELEQSGCDAAKILPDIWQFIQRSPLCRDLYECLRTLSELEQGQGLPRPDFRNLFTD